MLKSGSVVYISFLKEIQSKQDANGIEEFSRKCQMAISHKQGDTKTYENFNSVFKGTKEQLEQLKEGTSVDVGSFAVLNWSVKDDKTGETKKGYTFYVNDFKPHIWENKKEASHSKKQEDKNTDPFAEKEIDSNTLPF